MSCLTESKTAKIPPARFPDRPIDLAQERWWLVKTKSRQEKQLAFDFLDMGIEYYLPMYKKTCFTPSRLGCKSKKRFYTLPLFSGYMAFAQDSPNSIYKTGRVAQIIEVKNQLRFVKELSLIYTSFNSNQVVLPVNLDIKTDTEVEVICGPLKGTCGKVVDIRNSRFLVLAVEGMGRAMVKVSAEQCAVINS